MAIDDSFPFAEHRDCGTLTRLSIEHMPRDRSIGRRRKFRKNSEIWQSEDSDDRVYFLEGGEVAILSGDLGARDLLLQTVRVGEPFGEVCFCAEGKGQRNTVARARTDVAVLEIEFGVFLKYLRATPRALFALLCTFCVRLGECESTSKILAHRGAQERLGRLLVQLARRAAKQTTPARVPVALHLSHVELSRMAAMSRPHVSVTLAHFRRLRLLDYARGRALSVNVKALASYIASKEAAARVPVPKRGTWGGAS